MPTTDPVVEAQTDPTGGADPQTELDAANAMLTDANVSFPNVFTTEQIALAVCVYLVPGCMSIAEIVILLSLPPPGCHAALNPEPDPGDLQNGADGLSQRSPGVDGLSRDRRRFN